jgi:hypothetical protein
VFAEPRTEIWTKECLSHVLVKSNRTKLFFLRANRGPDTHLREYLHLGAAGCTVNPWSHPLLASEEPPFPFDHALSLSSILAQLTARDIKPAISNQ